MKRLVRHCSRACKAILFTPIHGETPTPLSVFRAAESTHVDTVDARQRSHSLSLHAGRAAHVQRPRSVDSNLAARRDSQSLVRVAKRAAPQERARAASDGTALLTWRDALHTLGPLTDVPDTNLPPLGIDRNQWLRAQQTAHARVRSAEVAQRRYTLQHVWYDPETGHLGVTDWGLHAQMRCSAATAHVKLKSVVRAGQHLDTLTYRRQSDDTRSSSDAALYRRFDLHSPVDGVLVWLRSAEYADELSIVHEESEWLACVQSRECIHVGTLDALSYALYEQLYRNQ